MCRLFRLGSFAATVMNATLAYSGWVGGGGAFLEDGDNPWFIQNTKSVTYCIMADEENFGLSLDQLRKLSAGAFDFWRLQISKIKYVDWADLRGNKAHIEVVTQNFSEESCDKNPDLTLQFGVLNDLQKEYLKDPTKYAGVSVRTDYDRTNLRGRGFIYLSPQKGPLKLKYTRLDQPWSYHDGFLAQIYLIHELGHVFGFQHDEGSFLTSSEIASLLDLPEILLSFIEKQLVRMKEGKDFLFASDNAMGYGYVGFSDMSKKLWGTVEGEEYVKIRVENNHFHVYARKDSSTPDSERLVGTALLRKEEFGPARNVGYFWFPNEQKVFPGFEMHTPINFGNTHSTARYEGIYRSLDGSIVRMMKISTYDPYNIDVGGELDGKMYIDFFKGI